jgi:hypothetical protein
MATCFASKFLFFVFRLIYFWSIAPYMRYFALFGSKE